jgi:hypothetical protein
MWHNRAIKRIVQGAVLIVSASFLAAYIGWKSIGETGPDVGAVGVTAGQVEPYPDCPYKLTISPAAPYLPSALAFVVSVENVGDDVWGWDQEFMTFLKWRVLIPGPKENRELPPSELSRHDHVEAPEQGCDRFTLLKPGDGAQKLYVLTEPYPAFGAETDVLAAPDGHGVVRYIPYEATFKYELSRGQSSTQISVVYRCSWKFSVALGRLVKCNLAKDARMWEGECTSNEVTVARRD